MNLSDYQNEAKMAKLELRLAEARLLYYQYLSLDCDLYDNACHIIVNDLRVPEKMEPIEAGVCKKHIGRITKIESLINKMR